MISNFALLLSHEGITLAHRTAEGWVELGYAEINDPELATTLANLRELAIEKGGVDFTTKLVLPKDQIKYLQLPATDDDNRDAVVKEALESSTPYLFEELAFDWEEGEDGMNIAVVARDTLVEAESFASQFGMNPACFVANPDDETFSVEPFFGLTEWVTEAHPDADEATAELTKVVLIDPDAADAIIEAVAIDVTEDAEQADEAEAEDDQAEADDVTEPEPEPEPEPENTAEVADEGQEETPDDAQDEPKEDDSPAVEADAKSEEPSEPEDEATRPRLGGASRELDDDAKGPILGRAPLSGPHSGVDKDVLDRSFPKWAGGSRRERAFDLDEDIDPEDVVWMSKGEADDEDPTASDSPPSWMGEASIHDDSGDDTDTAPSWIPTSKHRAHPLAYDQLSDEAEQMEVFGNRKDQRDERDGFPIMWIAAGVVALLILIGGGVFGFRAFFGSDEPAPQIADEPAAIEAPIETPAEEAEVAATETESASEPVVEDIAEAEPETIEVAPDVTVDTEALAEAPTPSIAPDLSSEADTLVEATEQPELPTVGETETIIEAPEPDALPALEETVETAETVVEDATEPVATAEDTAPEEATETEIVVVEPELESDEAEAEAPAIAMAPLRPGTETSLDEVSNTLPEPRADLLIDAGQNWETLSEDARAARYAATGIWPVAPDAPIAATGESVGDIFLTSIDPVVFATDAYAITPSAQMLSDKALTAMPNPPAAGTRFERDERGLIQATVEGAMTPDGIIVYATIPPQIPPLAPRPDPQAEADAQRAALAGKIPRLRPELAVEDEATAPDPDAEVEGIATGGPSSPARLRPAEIAALADEPEIVNPLALSQTPTPRLRPANFSQIIYNTERAAIAAQTTTNVAPTRANVGEAATEDNALNLRGVSLIGIYGESGDRRALVRLNNGRYQKIEVGDRLDGGTVTAIDGEKVYYTKRGQSLVLEMP